MPDAGGQVPPNALDAEGAVLSACLLDQSAYDQVQALLRPEHFYADANRRIYEAIEELSAKGKPVDIISVKNVLSDHNRLQQVGGSPYLAQLADATPAVANVISHAQLVVDKWSVRQIIYTCRTVVAEGYGDIGPVANWKQSVDQRVYDITRQRELDDQFSLLGTAAADEVRQIQERRKRKGLRVDGITTGMPTLDLRIGGLKRGLKYEIGARSGMGKTGLLLNMAIAAARAGWGTVIVSLEMPRDQLALRALSQESNIDGHRLGMGKVKDHEWQDLVEAAVALQKLPLIICDTSLQTPSSIRSTVRDARRRLREKFGDDIELGVVGIDYMQLMRVAPNVMVQGDAELTAISQATMQLAKDENCVVLECAQLNREVEKRPDKRPMASDFRSSGSIEQDAFAIFMLYRDDFYRKEGEARDNNAEILVRKVRNGGATGTVHVKFKPETVTFYETSTQPDIKQLQDMFDEQLDHYVPGTYGESEPVPNAPHWQDGDDD